MSDAIRRARPPKAEEDSAIELAREFNADFGDVLEMVAEHRAIRRYDGNYSPDEADRLGLQDVRDILTARSRRSR